MLWVAVLFAVFGSVGDVAETVTVFVMVPFLVGLIVISTVAVSPLFNVPRLQLTTIFFEIVHVPWVVVTDPFPVFLGSVSVRDTPVALDGPLFVTGMV